MSVRQTACRYCDADIEAFHPYKKGTWRDRGNNWTCDKSITGVHRPYPFEKQLPPKRTRSKRKITKVVERPYQASYYHTQARRCVRLLIDAREHAKAAGAPYTVERIKLAISSARGAVRNAGYRVSRAERKQS